MTTLFQRFIAGPWAYALGWSVLHSLWQGVIAALIFALVLAASKSPRVRYAAGYALLVALFLSLAGTFLYFAPPSGRRFQDAGALPSPNWRVRPIAGASDWGMSLETLAPWLAPIWMIGVAIFYLRFAAGFVSVERLARRGVCAAAEAWQEKTPALARTLGVTRAVRLLESSLAEAPILVGHLRPAILVPIGMLAGLPAAQVEMILLHELAHVLRRDYLFNALQNILEGFLFYHPAVWWISHVVRTEREHCCDDLVVQASGRRVDYANALAALEETRWSGREPAVAAKGGSLMERIRRLLYPASAPGLSWGPLAATAILLLSTAAAVSAWQGNLANPTSDLPQRWLNEDVVYIIDGAERAQFSKLTTDAEREQFVQKFWERRNPNPGSAENKFKTEHYRRIAYANKHFDTSAGTPGWQTDRGHMYILYGPPYEIDDHPRGEPAPWQTWGYRDKSGEKFFNFVDAHASGDYRLAPSASQ